MKTWILDENMDAENEREILQEAARFDAARQQGDKITATAAVAAVAPVRDTLAENRRLRGLLEELGRLCPDESGLGGHAPLAAFYNVAHKARAALATWEGRP